MENRNEGCICIPPCTPRNTTIINNNSTISSYALTLSVYSPYACVPSPKAGALSEKTMPSKGLLLPVRAVKAGEEVVPVFSKYLILPPPATKSSFPSPLTAMHMVREAGAVIEGGAGGSDQR